MHYTPRTIVFVCDLQHPGGAPDAAAVQRIHNGMFEAGDPPYRSFNVTHEGAVLSNPKSRPDEISMVSFLPNRILFREEHTGLTAEEFGQRVSHLVGQACEQLSIQIFTSQQVTIRTLVNPRQFGDSRAYLRHGVLHVEGEESDFGREARLLGMRLVFPADRDHPQVYSLRIESYHQDPRSLWIENQGTFPAVFARRGTEPLRHNVDATYGFLVERALRFVGRFDGREDAP